MKNIYFSRCFSANIILIILLPPYLSARLTERAGKHLLKQNKYKDQLYPV